MNIDKLVNLLKGHKVFLQTHNFPDPDALASAYGLQVLLRRYGIDTTICYEGKIEKVTSKRMLTVFGITAVEKNDLTDMTQDDYIVTIDGQKYNANFTDLIGNDVACIDHHPTYKECEYLYSDIRIVGACATLIAEYFIDSGIVPDTNTATALLYGINMDTSSFSRGVTDLDIEMFRFLHALADKNIINNLNFNTLELQDLKAYGAAIENVHVYDQFGFVHIPFNCNDALIAMISEFVLSLDVVEISVVYADRSGGYKFSVRSENSSVHSGTLIKTALDGYGDGGGHFSMSGGIIPEENMSLLGDFKIEKIESLFLTAREMLGKS